MAHNDSALAQGLKEFDRSANGNSNVLYVFPSKTFLCNLD